MHRVLKIAVFFSLLFGLLWVGVVAAELSSEHFILQFIDAFIKEDVVNMTELVVKNPKTAKSAQKAFKSIGKGQGKEAETARQLGKYISKIITLNTRQSKNKTRAREVHGGLSDDPKLKKADILNKEVMALYQAGQHEKAISKAQQALKLRRDVLGEDHPDVAESLNNLAALYNAMGRYKDVEPLCKRSLEIYEKAYGKDHPDVAKSLNNLAVLYDATGRYGEAEPLLRRSLEISEQLLGKDHPNVAESLNNLAELYRTTDRYGEAEPLYRRSLEIREKVYGKNHPDVATSLNNLAELYYEKARYGEAEPLYRRSLEIREKVLGKDHTAVAESLNNLAELYRTMSRYGEAEPLHKRSLEISEKIHGKDHPNVATSLNNLAELYRTMNRYGDAEPLYKRSLEMREKAFGKDHTAIADSLNNLAILYYDTDRYREAEPLFKRSLEIWGKVLGKDHSTVATSLNNLAKLYYATDRYSDAEPLYKRSLEIREKVNGKDHTDVAESLNNLAGLYYTMSRYGEAEPLYRRSLEIREKINGKDHTDVAESLNNLARLYYTTYRYRDAEPLYKRSLEIREKVNGKDHPDVASSLNNLAELYITMSRYGEAEPLLRRSLEISAKVLGQEHSNVATNLNNLAGLYKTTGRNGEAEFLLKRSLEISEKIHGKDHPKIAIILNNLAALYNNTDRYGEAEPLYKQALDILEKVHGKDHPHTAIVLNNLAELYYVTDRYSETEPLYKRSLEILEKLLGKNHPHVATSLNNLALLYRTTGHYGEAEPLLKRALEIREKVFGINHSDVAESFNALAVLYTLTNRDNAAYHLMLRAQEIDDHLLDQAAAFSTEEDKLKFVATKKDNLHTFFSLALERSKKDGTVNRQALDVWLKRKGIIQEVQKRFQEVLLLADDSEGQKLVQELSLVRSRLSRLIFSGPGKEGIEIYQRQRDDLEEEKQQIEEELGMKSRSFATAQKVRKADSQQLASVLPPSTVMVEFARVEITDFKATGKASTSQPARYLTFILPAGAGGKISLIDLGDAVKIDTAAAALKEAIKEAGKSKETIQEKKAVEKASADLYKLVFSPLIKDLGVARKIFLSPDGSLNLMPFELLMSPERRYLIEDFTFNYVAAGRDILGFTTTGDRREKVNIPLIMGDPDFDMDDKARSSEVARLGLKRSHEEETMPRSSDMSGRHFRPLPGTRVEVEAVYALMGGKGKAELYTGREALEEVLKSKERPRILHLATHGFFLRDQEIPEGSVGKRGEILPFNSAKGKPVKAVATQQMRYENPLLRSGIALAGANKSVETGTVADSSGIVTAEKILDLRLRGTEMVVLSACETGLGEVKSGEGVFGLRRAFTQAGTKSLVMSMWSVPDQETKELMVAFYGHLLSGKMNRSQSLRTAALEQMATVKERCGWANPYYWAAFVFLGEP